MVHTSVWFMLMMLTYWEEAYTIKDKAEALVMDSKEIQLEVNADEIKYLVMSRDQNAGRSHKD